MLIASFTLFTLFAAEPGSVAERDAMEARTGAAVESTGSTFEVTSRDRDNSAAHRENRAIDYRGTDHSAASAASHANGAGHRVIVEEVHGDGTQTNTYYEHGRPGHYGPAPYKVERVPQTATGSHTHVQRNSGVSAAR